MLSFNNKKIISLSFFVFLFIIFVPYFFASASLLPANESCDCSIAQVPTVCVEVCKNKTGNYSLNDLVAVAVRATEILLTLSGSVALLMFIYGGVVFLISAGSSEKVSQGRQIISNAVIGLIIIFSSFIIIQVSMAALGYEKNETFGAWNQSK